MIQDFWFKIFFDCCHCCLFTCLKSCYQWCLSSLINLAVSALSLRCRVGQVCEEVMRVPLVNMAWEQALAIWGQYSMSADEHRRRTLTRTFHSSTVRANTAAQKFLTTQVQTHTHTHAVSLRDKDFTSVFWDGLLVFLDFLSPFLSYFLLDHTAKWWCHGI